MNANICAQCNVCADLLPEQTQERTLIVEAKGVPSPILVLDDPEYKEDYEIAISIATRLLDTAGFDYSPTVRCECKVDHLDAAVVSRCAVWTNLVSERRHLILSTRRGLNQLKVGEEWKEGDLFRVGKLGLVLCIPPLIEISPVQEPAYRHRVQRVLREMGAIA